MTAGTIRRLSLCGAIAWVALVAGPVGAQGAAEDTGIDDRTGSPGATAREEAIFGRDLMTEDEIRAHRERMRSFQTDAEREAYRVEHHRQMTERARERGITLPEEPPAVGAGRGMGMGTGRGAGPGGPGSGGGMDTGPRSETGTGSGTGTGTGSGGGSGGGSSGGGSGGGS